MVSVLVSMTNVNVYVLFSACLVATEGKKKFSTYVFACPQRIYCRNFCSRSYAPYAAQLFSSLPIECQTYVLHFPRHNGEYPAIFVTLETKIGILTFSDRGLQSNINRELVHEWK